jgi:hypothetical protein
MIVGCRIFIGFLDTHCLVVLDALCLLKQSPEHHFFPRVVPSSVLYHPYESFSEDS